MPNILNSRESSADFEGGCDENICISGLSNDDLENILSLDDEKFIFACYETILKRQPDPAGFGWHLVHLRSGADRVDVLRAFASSPEAVALSQRTDAPPAPDAMVRLRRQVGALAASRGDAESSLWVDMTTSFEWTGGIVGIVRAELELAAGLKKLNPSVRFSMQIEDGFAEIPSEELNWLLTADNVADAYMTFFARAKNSVGKPGVLTLTTDAEGGFFHPYRPGDVIISAGWMDSKKEGYFGRLKARLPTIKLVYLIYDIILLLPQTRHFYDATGCDRFKRYIKWISHNADFILYGGETARRDMEKLQADEGWPVKPGRAIKFGTDITKSNDPTAIPQLLSEVGVREPFIMTVGSIEPRKNHETLYRAYRLALEAMGEATPQLVIVGKPMWRADELVDTFKRDPILQDKVIFATPSDAQLAALYARCCFTLLPSLYEGWNLTLPESLGQGKFCISCDTPPLREIGQGLVDYVEPFDARGWADHIVFYATNAASLARREERIRRDWPTLRWIDTAEMVLNAVTSFPARSPSNALATPSIASTQPTIWMDITLSFLQWGGGVNGIVRAELTFAYYLKKLQPETRFFAYQDNTFFEVKEGFLSWLFDGNDLSIQYKGFQDYWNKYEKIGSGFRNPLRGTGQHPQLHEAYLAAFPENSIIFFAAIDSDGTGRLHRNREVLDLITPDSGTMTSQLLYDFTPMLTPQFHAESTCAGYVPFVDFISQHYDHLIYGGRTAQRDGILYQKRKGLRSPPSDFIEFGSDLKLACPMETQPQPHDHELIARLGVTGDFVMTVGTIEPRKNHEGLYKAYLRLMEKGSFETMPQLVFAGRQGWKSDAFLATLRGDERVAGKILLVQPTDDELAALYRSCKFTLLPSFYEGWSLTLPESLSYGKFCLVSDVDPLRETGRDLVEYVNPFDIYKWADRIEHYLKAPGEIAAREARIAVEWHPTTWRQSTERLIEILHEAHAQFVSHRTNSVKTA